MKKRIFLLISSFILCLSGTLYLRFNRIETTFNKALEEVKTVEFNLPSDSFSNNEDNPRNQYLNDYKNITDFNELENQSDVIALVSIVERKQDFNIITTTLKIDKLYKGDCDTFIDVYEPAYISSVSHDFLYMFGVHPLMKTTNKYILFLQKALPENEDIFNFTNLCLSIYPVVDKIIIKDVDLDIEESISLLFKKEDVNNFDLLNVNLKNTSNLSNEEKDSINNYYNHINAYSETCIKVFNKYIGKAPKIIHEK